LSLTQALVPAHATDVPMPVLKDRMTSYNGLPLNFDTQAKIKMKKWPPEDVYIKIGLHTYNAGVNIAYIYDNINGGLYYNNGNLDAHGRYFYEW